LAAPTSTAVAQTFAYSENQSSDNLSVIDISTPDVVSPSQLRSPWPISFEVNKGQADARVRFLMRALGYTTYLTATDAVFVIAPRKVRRDAAEREFEQTGTTSSRASSIAMRFVGAQPAPELGWHRRTAHKESLPAWWSATAVAA
jgi:hypothetical protein